MGKIKIISIIAIMITILSFCVSTAIYAKATDQTGGTNLTKIDTSKYNPGELTGVRSATGKAQKIVTILRVIGTIIAVIGLMALGIKYMAGSVEQRADYKKTMIPYLMGCIMIFATVTIISIIYDIVQSMNK